MREITFCVRNLPVDLPKQQPPPSKKNPDKTPTAKLHCFYPGRVPKEDNYAHGEIWTFKERVRVENPKLSTIVEKDFRQIMSDRGKLILRPIPGSLQQKDKGNLPSH